MQVQIKQTEIVSAIKGYLTTQGINLQGKTVEITFTAGRKESGLTADISIEDEAQPMSKFFEEKEAFSPETPQEPEAPAETTTEAPKTPNLFGQ